MCDTFGVLGTNKIFGKNSDRSPNEIQVIEYVPKHRTKNKILKATYLEIPEVDEVFSILISRPTWMWGAEMGVNEYGVVIGNEAIFTKGRYKKNRSNWNGFGKTCTRKIKNCKRSSEYN